VSDASYVNHAWYHHSDSDQNIRQTSHNTSPEVQRRGTEVIPLHTFRKVKAYLCEATKEGNVIEKRRSM
jgi:hypothetical protein